MLVKADSKAAISVDAEKSEKLMVKIFDSHQPIAQAIIEMLNSLRF